MESWWRHQVKKISASLALCEGNPPMTGGFPSQRPVTRSFDALFDLRLNKRLSKQSGRRDWRRHHAHYEVTVMITWMDMLTEAGLLNVLGGLFFSFDQNKCANDIELLTLHYTPELLNTDLKQLHAELSYFGNRGSNFLNKNVWVSLKISLKFVLTGPIDN